MRNAAPILSSIKATKIIQEKRITRMKILLLARLGCLMGMESIAELTPDEIIPYKTVGDSELKLHAFYPEEHNKSQKRPAILFFFGSGGKTGTPSQFYPQNQYLAKRRMVAIRVDYRTRQSLEQLLPTEN